MAHSRSSPQDIINFPWSALCACFAFRFAVFCCFAQNAFWRISLEITRRENYIMIGAHKKGEGKICFEGLYERLIMCSFVCLIALLFVFAARRKTKQKDDAYYSRHCTHAVLKKIGCRRSTEREAPLGTCVCSPMSTTGVPNSLYTLASLTFFSRASWEMACLMSKGARHFLVVVEAMPIFQTGN